MANSAKLFLATLLLAGLVVASGGEVPTNYAHFWEESDSPVVCITSLPKLGIARERIVRDADVDFLAREFDAEAFSTELGLLRDAGEEMDAAKRVSTYTLPILEAPYVVLYREDNIFNAQVGLTFLARYIHPCKTAMLVATRGASLLACRFWNDAERRACEAMSHSVRALEEAALASNRARALALAELANLERMGAGEPGYAGPEKAVLLHERALLNGTGTEGEGYAMALRMAADVQDAFELGGANLDSRNSFIRLLNLLAGKDDSLVSQWMASRARSVEAERSMELAYSQKLSSVKMERDGIMEELRELERERYQLITQSVLNALSPPGELKPDSGISPAEELRALASQAARSRVLIAEAEALHSDAVQQGYLAKAMERLDSAAAGLALLRSSLESLRTRISKIEAEARKEAEEGVRELSKELREYNVTTPGAATVAKNAREMLEQAEEEIRRSESLQAAGARIAALSGAVSKLSAARRMLSDSTRLDEDQRRIAGDALDELERLIGLAEKDGLETFGQRTFLRDARATLPNARAADASALVRMTAGQIDMLYAASAARLSSLNAKRAELLPLITAMRAYSSLLGSSGIDDEAAAFDELEERYVTTDGYDAYLALGHYEEIRKGLERIGRGLKAKRKGILKALLERSAQVELNYDSEPELDSPTVAVVKVRLYNPSPISLNESLEVELPNPSGERLQLSGGDARISVADADRERISINLRSVEAGARYALRLSGKGDVYARTLSLDEELVSLSREEARFAVRISFTAQRELNSLRVRTRVRGTPSLLDAELSNGFVRSLRNAGNGEVVADLAGIRRGSGELVLRYSVANPYSVELGAPMLNRTDNRTARVLQNVTVTARIALTNIPVSIELPGAAGIRLDWEGGPVPFSTDASSVSWKIGSMGEGESRTYLLSYDADMTPEHAAELYSEAESYMRSIMGEISESDASLLRATLEEAKAAMDTGGYVRAIELLVGLRAQGEAMLEKAEQERRSRTAYESALLELRDAREKANSLLSVLREAGLDGEVELVERAISESERLEQNGRKRAEQGRADEGAELLLRAAEALELSQLRRPLLERTSELEKGLDSVSEKVEVLSPLANTTAVESKLHVAAAALKETRRAVASGELAAAAEALRDAREKMDSVLAALRDTEGAAGTRVELGRERLGKLKERLSPLLSDYEQAIHITVSGRLPDDDRLKELRNETLREEAESLSEELRLLEKFFSAPELARLPEVEGRLAALEGAGATLSEAVEKYSTIASELYEEAKAKLTQAKEILPASSQYADELENLSALQREADGALRERRFADAAVLSAKVVAGTARLLAAASFAEQKELEQGGGFQPIHLFVPLALFAGLGYLYFKRKPAKPPEPRTIPMGESDPLRADLPELAE